MPLRVSTTGSDVILNDLGVTITHPTVNRDLTIEFTSEEIRNSNNLTNAIQNEDLIADDGQFQIDSADYDPIEMLSQELNLKLDSRFISHEELLAGKQNIPIKDGVFPITINSTAASTRNVYIPTAKWGTWQIDTDDIVVITGSDAAGVYTVESVIDSQNFIVEQSIVDSTGGTCTVYHPASSTRIGVDSSTLVYSDGETLQDVLEDINTLSGVNNLTEETHKELDQLVHLIAETSYEEVIYSGIQPVSLIVWTNDSKLTKIREEIYTWQAGNKINTLTTIQYDAGGLEVERTEETYTYSGVRVVSINREFV